MKEDIYNYLENFDEETKQRFNLLYRIICESTTQTINEKFWAKLPSFYVDNNFVRIIPFKDHINIESKNINFYKEELLEYKLTPKGMLQIFNNQQVPYELLKIIFKENFEEYSKNI
ncbi:hypothetical protein [Clostridium nigeriense]|uniref:hypothetical protein n=1 Tax=Clostridium nigeriense TaxID=1805470 RepID=UPI00083304F2|nr:hypothetical protein [Clostridium nigeriense]